jgi:predicted  nucleic acid-binding Zn-ribbon protein
MGQVLDEIQAENTDLLKQVSRLEKELKEANDKIDDLEDDIKDKDKEIDDLEEEVSDLNIKVDTLEDEIESLERDSHDVGHVPARLIQNDLDTIGKMEVVAEHFDKYNYFQLKERLEK